MMVSRHLLVFLVLLACAVPVQAGDPAPTTEPGRQALALLATHGAALEEEDLESARSARLALAALVEAGEVPRETTFRYARALRTEAGLLRQLERGPEAAPLAATLEALALAAGADDDTRTERALDLGGQWLQAWRAEGQEAAEPFLAGLRAWVSGADAGPRVLDAWLWVLDDVHRVAGESKAYAWSDALLDEMRAVVDERGATAARVGELMRSLARLHLRLRNEGAQERADAILDELRRRGAPWAGAAPSVHLGDALVDLHAAMAEAGRWDRADAALEVLRAAVRTHDTAFARADLLTALANAIFDHGRIRDAQGLPALLQEARALGGRADADAFLRTEVVRALRNACLDAASRGPFAEAEALRAEAATLVAGADVTQPMRNQYAALLGDAIRRFLRRDAYGAAVAFLAHGRALADAVPDAEVVRETYMAMLVDVHILAERAQGPEAVAARARLLAEMQARAHADGATESERADLARGLYNQHFHALARGASEATRDALAALRVLVGEQPIEATPRGELLQALRREQEARLPEDAAGAAACLAEARTLVGAEARPDHRSILLQMVVAALWQALIDARDEDAAALESDLRARAGRPDVTEEERRSLLTGLRYLAQLAAEDDDWEPAIARLDELRALAARAEATEAQRSELARALEVLARLRLDAGSYALGLAMVVELRALATRPAAVAYQRERLAWLLVDAQRAARAAQDTRTSGELSTALQAMVGQGPAGDAVAEPLARLLVNEEAFGIEQGSVPYAERVTQMLRVLADGPRGNPGVADDLALVLDRRIWRLLEASPVDWAGVDEAVGELRRRAHAEGATELGRDELADTLMRGHAVLGDAQRWEPAAAWLEELRILARRPTATARQRHRLAQALADETWDAGAREAWEPIPTLMDELRALAAAHPDESGLVDQVARGCRIAHQMLGETDDHIAPALAYLDELRTLVHGAEGVPAYRWTELANALANATNFAQFDVDLAAAHRVLDELRALCARPEANEDQQHWLVYALRHLVRAGALPRDRERLEGYLAEIEATVARPGTGPGLRSQASIAWQQAWEVLDGEAEPAEGAYILAALRRWAEDPNATESQQDIHADVAATAYERYAEQDRAEVAAALGAGLRELAGRADTTEHARSTWTRILGARVAGSLEDGSADIAAPAWQALHAWVLRADGSAAERRVHAAALARAARAARGASDAPRAAGFFRALEAVVAADPTDDVVLRLHREALTG